MKRREIYGLASWKFQAHGNGDKKDDENYGNGGIEQGGGFGSGDVLEAKASMKTTKVFGLECYICCSLNGSISIQYSYIRILGSCSQFLPKTSMGIVEEKARE